MNKIQILKVNCFFLNKPPVSRPSSTRLFHKDLFLKHLLLSFLLLSNMLIPCRTVSGYAVPAKNPLTLQNNETKTTSHTPNNDKTKADALTSNSDKTKVDAPALHAKAAILMDGRNQRVLLGKEAETPLPMASTTKIMTCLYALEHGNLTDTVTFSGRAASAPKVHLGAPAGSRFLLSDLLYALMLESDNDAAVAIAEHIGGSVEKFCEDMTQEARDYGCYHTSFETPNGLDSKNHYTTCHDLAILTCRALHNRQFRKIIRESSYSIKDLANGTSYSLRNKNAFLNTYPGAIGVKTGFTSGAGYCFVGAVKQKDHYLISVILGCGWPPHRSWKWEDTKKLMDYGTKNYSRTRLGLTDELPEYLPVDCGQTGTCRIMAKDSISLLVSQDEAVTVKTDIPSCLQAPVSDREIVGSVSVYIDHTLYRSYPVISLEKVRRIDYRFCLHRLQKDFILSAG